MGFGFREKGISFMKNRKTEFIRIELKSDLCDSSGYSYAGIVDSDICYDEYGIPYIPAKRLKGCFRNTYETILYQTKYENPADELFGTKGMGAYENSSNPTLCENDAVITYNQEKLIIGNAYLSYYESIRKQLKEKSKNKVVGQFYDTQHILDRFTHVVAQTEIKDGMAVDTSLRYTRVVDHISPFDTQSNLVFYAKVSYEDVNNYREMLNDAVRGTRHIGLKRNRGMGNVYCKLVPNQDNSDDNNSKKDISEPEEGQCQKNIYSEQLDENNVCITYCIENSGKLMLSSEKENISENYISGQNMLGCFASRYLQNNSAYEGDTYTKEFNDLFLNGKTIFTNLYPYVDGKIHYPAPEYINTLKLSEKVVNILGKISPGILKDEDYNPSKGNRPRRLKRKFVALDGNNVSIHEVKKDVVYHHSKKMSKSIKDGSEEEGILFGLEVLRPGQQFMGHIYVPNQYENTVKELLDLGLFRLGKSKSSEYGECRNVSIMDYKPKQEISIEAGKTVVVTFLSDAIFTDEKGRYSVYYDQVYKSVANLLKLKEKVDTDDYTSIIQTTKVSGYKGIWNLRKDVIPAIRAGSCLVYQCEENINSGVYFVGECNAEGYGQVRVDDVESMEYCLTKKQNVISDSPKEVPDMTDENIKKLVGSILLGNWLVRKKSDLLSDSGNKFDVSNTANNRIILMLQESISENDKCEEAFTNFSKRIESISLEETRKQGEKILQIVGEKEELDDNKIEWKLKEWLGLVDIEAQQQGKTVFAESEAELRELQTLNYGYEELNSMVQKCWSDYLMTILVNRKYEGRKQ